MLSARGNLRLLVVMMTMTLRSVSGHGRLVEPPSRSSMWRYGFNTPHNYDDNALNCGGLNTQWYVNNGKCGVCGDPWSQPSPRDNEAGGRYGKGIITRTYTPGQTVDVRIEVTANHKGWFEFRLCPHNSPSTPISQQCLDRYLLPLADGSGTRYTLSPLAGVVDVKLKLPPGLTCTQCVLQWKWHAGNNFGSVQEEFYGCSDVAIGTSASLPPVILPTTAPSTAHPTAPPTARPTAPPTAHPTAPPTAHPTAPPTARPTAPPTARPTAPPTAHPTAASATGRPVGASVCRGINSWQGVAELDRYCSEQCPLGNCPPMYCSCSGSAATTRFPVTTAPPLTTTAPFQMSCHAVGTWQGSVMLDAWCRDNCAQGLCPPQNCQCYASAGVQTTAAPTAPTATRSFTTASLTSAQTGQPVSAVCRGINSWQGVAELDRYCNEQCPLGNCPPMYCSCSAAATARPATVPPSKVIPVLATATPPTTVVASLIPTSHCFAIGNWQGDTKLDLWCNENCPQGLCPSQNCQCDAHASHNPTAVPVTPLPTTPSSTTQRPAAGHQQCRAVGTWAGQPNLDLWCSQTCAQFGCDPQYCSCSPGTTSPANVATTPTLGGIHRKLCFAINGWAGSAQLDQYCNEQCHRGLCPPQYCACGPRPTAQLTSQSQITPFPSATATLPPVTTAPTQQGQCRAVNTWQGVTALDDWCRVQCAQGNCPPAYCHCSP